MASPVRVLAIGNVYPPHHLGGYEIIWRGVMRYLRQQGHVGRVLVSDYRNPTVSGDALGDPEVHRELEWYWRGHEWPALGLRARLALERRNAARFDRHVRELNPDVITWWSLGGLSLSLLERARQAGIPSLVFVLDPWPSYGRERDLWLRTWAHLPFAAGLVQRATGIPARVRWADVGRWVFCSAAMAESTAAAGLRIARARSTILSPGVERSFLEVLAEPAPPPWRWRLLYLGRVVEQKGVATAVASLAELPPGAHLSIVGEGDPAYRAQLAELAERLGVAERVSLEPARPREQLVELIRGADAVLFPVEWPEPWGLVPLEAMALGRPVLATGTGGSGDYLRDERNSLLFRAGDPAALAAAVRRLAADEGLRQRLIEGGRQTAAAHSEDAFNQRALAEILAAARAPRARR